MGLTLKFACLGIRLAWWTRMDGIELVAVRFAELERISLMGLEWTVRLRLVVHANHVETCTVVSHGSTAGAAEQVQ